MGVDVLVEAEELGHLQIGKRVLFEELGGFLVELFGQVKNEVPSLVELVQIGALAQREIEVLQNLLQCDDLHLLENAELEQQLDKVVVDGPVVRDEVLKDQRFIQHDPEEPVEHQRVLF